MSSPKFERSEIPRLSMLISLGYPKQSAICGASELQYSFAIIGKPATLRGKLSGAAVPRRSSKLEYSLNVQFLHCSKIWKIADNFMVRLRISLCISGHDRTRGRALVTPLRISRSSVNNCDDSQKELKSKFSGPGLNFLIVRRWNLADQLQKPLMSRARHLASSHEASLEKYVCDSCEVESERMRE